MEKRDIERYVYVIAFLLYGLYSLFSGDMPRNTVNQNSSYFLYGVAVVLGIFTLLRRQSATVLFGLYMFYAGVLQLYIFFTVLFFSGPYRRMLPSGDMVILFIAGAFCVVGGYRLIEFALKDFRGTEKAGSATQGDGDADNSMLTVERVLYCFGVPLASLFYIYVVEDGASVLSAPNLGGLKTLYILTVVVPSLYLLLAGVVSFFQRRFPAVLFGGYLIGLGGAFFLSSRIIPHVAGYLPMDSDAVIVAVVGIVGLLIGLRVVHLGLKEEPELYES